MAAVARLVTLLELADDGDGVDVCARQEAELNDGRRVLLLDDRGWSSSPGIGRLDQIEVTARTVVGPDEPTGARTQAEAWASHWNALATILERHGVVIDATTLSCLRHDVVIGDRLGALIRDGSGDGS